MTHVQCLWCNWKGKRKRNPTLNPCPRCKHGVMEYNPPPKTPNKYVTAILAQCQEYGVPEPVLEYKFHPTRKWRLDVAWLSFKVSLEIQGGTWSGGRHTRGTGYEKDREKSAYAQLNGWIALEATGKQVKNYDAIKWVQQAIEQRDRLPW